MNFLLSLPVTLLISFTLSFGLSLPVLPVGPAALLGLCVVLWMFVGPLFIGGILRLFVRGDRLEPNSKALFNIFRVAHYLSFVIIMIPPLLYNIRLVLPVLLGAGFLLLVLRVVENTHLKSGLK